MNCFHRYVPALAALLLCAAAAAEARPIDERRPLKANAEVSVSNVAGSVEVETWDRNELHLTGELAEEVEELKIEGNESSLRIEVKLPQRTRYAGDTRLRLKLPVGAALDAETVSADVTVKGLRGPIGVESVSGDIALDVVSGRVEAQSVSGDVRLHAPSTEARVETVSGDIAVNGPRGELRGKSVSGDLSVQARALRRLTLETVSGDLELDLALTKDAEVTVETLSGAVQVALPELPDGELKLETFSGELHSDWSQELGESKEYRRSGSGRSRLRLHSFSGDIRLLKK
jgi:DUF4097 and DUF4098 domain-containing protein YvlB